MKRIHPLAVGLALWSLASLSFAGASLKGTGSALGQRLVLAWIADYAKAHSEVEIQYDPKNAADSRDEWLDLGADFVLSELPLDSPDVTRIRQYKVLTLPVALQGIAFTYNLPGVGTGLHLSPKIVSDMFKGSIKAWNDPDIQALNPGVELPDLPVVPLFRDDEKTQKDLLPDWLLHLDPAWTAGHENDKEIPWPDGTRVDGNEKVAELMRQWPGVLAAVDGDYAIQKNLPTVALRNQAGEFVQPSLQSLQAATDSIVELPDDFTVLLTGSTAPHGYPLCTFEWLWVLQDGIRNGHDVPKEQALKGFVEWVLTDGQKTAQDHFYAPIPPKFLTRIQQAADGIETQ